jgi:hypothetical protein
MERRSSSGVGGIRYAVQSWRYPSMHAVTNATTDDLRRRMRYEDLKEMHRYLALIKTDEKLRADIVSCVADDIVSRTGRGKAVDLPALRDVIMIEADWLFSKSNRIPRGLLSSVAKVNAMPLWDTDPEHRMAPDLGLDDREARKATMMIQDAILFVLFSRALPEYNQSSPVRSEPTRSSGVQSEVGAHADPAGHYGPFYHNEDDEAEAPLVPHYEAHQPTQAEKKANEAKGKAAAKGLSRKRKDRGQVPD